MCESPSDRSSTTSHPDPISLIGASISTCMPSVPNPAPSTSSDDSIIVDMRAVLTDALRMPSRARWVADWLFANPDDPFHANITLPPEAFHTTLSINMMQALLPSNHSQQAPPIVRDTLMLFLPVAHIDGVTVGYTFGRGDILGSDKDKDKSSPSPIPFSPNYVGRFSYDTIANECVVIVHSVASSVTAICGASAMHNSQRRRYFLAVPRLQYGFHNLPSRPLSMMTSLEYRYQNCPRFDVPPFLLYTPYDSTIPLPVQSNGSTPDILVDLNHAESNPRTRSTHSTTLRSTISNSIASAETSFPDDSCASNSNSTSDNQVILSHYLSDGSPTAHAPRQHPNMACNLPSANMPWILTDQGATADGICRPRYPGKNDTSSGAFHLDSLRFSLQAMARTLNGYFIGDRTRHDFLNPMTGDLSSQYTGRLQTQQLAVEDAMAESMREAAAFCYYTYRLSPVSDTRFIASYANDEQLLEIARTIMPHLIKSNSRFRGKDKITALQKESKQARQDRQQKRRVMNRLSAAKSNHKKRLELEGLQTELEVMRKKATLLHEKRKLLAKENMALKQSVDNRHHMIHVQF